MWRALQEVGSNSETPGAIPLNFNAHQNGSEVFQISMEQIDRYLNKDSKPRTNPADKLPREYYEYLDVFNRDAAEKLPNHRPYDYKIKLEDDLKFGHSPLRGTGKTEL